MIVLEHVLPADEIAQLRDIAARAPWVAGQVSARGRAAQLKNNRQVDAASPESELVAQQVMAALQRHPLFAIAAMPGRVTRPVMNRYDVGMTYGPHFDSPLTPSPNVMRTDLSGTLFLSDPADYDGGELVVDTSQGRQVARLPAGQLVLYPSARMHHVTPVTRGTRLAVIFWIESVIRDHEERSVLFDLSRALGGLEAGRLEQADVERVAGAYHRLLQMWAQP